MRKLRNLAVAIVAPALVACGSSSDTSGTEEPAEHFKGEKVTIIVPFGAGGGADVAARLLAPFLSEELPGKPTVIIENKEGGGGALAMNDVVQAPADALTMVVITPGTQARWLTGEEGHDYPLPDFHALAGVLGSGITFTTKSTADSLEDLIARSQTEPWVTGNSNRDSGPSLIEKNAAELLGLKLKQTFGYGGYGEVALAMLRGEIEGSSMSAGAFTSSFGPIKKKIGGYTNLFQQGVVGEDGNIDRSEFFKDVPTIAEAYEEVNGKPLEGEELELHRGLILLNTLQQLYIVAPKTPDTYVTALREAFSKALNNPEFLAKATDAYGGSIDVLDGAVAQDQLKEVTSMPDQVKQYIIDSAEE
ncbi:MAG: hypothetical protein GEV28_19715 [Actinophytocola sp.]|uniref:tripartite tricarboxylate transporter substrate-binding protein n=1 Tax=Actinophytocola sp. TaxID=1872138 RepID=UPI00132070F5|nr:tripartite tricarboxylate transporter substrate-binding protein [Actinophytocola sp.]MPZ82504.1 hypothetical protein [Actinophytocola sp.]